VTTRKARPIEKSGRDYLFVDQARFEEMRARNAFLEWAKVFGHYYGTLRAPVEEKLSEGKDMLFDVDWQGRQQLADAMGADVVSVFILPPTARELARRLSTRAQDKEGDRQHRMQFASSEISHYAEYDYIIINTALEESLQQLRAILAAERMKRARQLGLGQFVKGLVEELEPKSD